MITTESHCTAHTENVTVKDGALVTFAGTGLQVRAGYNDPLFGSQPFVTINTERLTAAHTYDERTGLRGDAEPFTIEADGDVAWIVTGPDGAVARFGATAPGINNRQLAEDTAASLNGTWAEDRCGMPSIAVHLNDTDLYDDQGKGDVIDHVSGREVYVTEVFSSDEPAAVFADFDQARAYALTFENADTSDTPAIDIATGKRMILERLEGEGADMLKLVLDTGAITVDDLDDEQRAELGITATTEPEA